MPIKGLHGGAIIHFSGSGLNCIEIKLGGHARNESDTPRVSLVSLRLSNREATQELMSTWRGPGFGAGGPHVRIHVCLSSGLVKETDFLHSHGVHIKLQLQI